MRLTEAQRESVDRLRNRCLVDSSGDNRSPIERSDLEDAVSEWLENHGGDAGSAPALVDNGATPDALDELARSLDADVLRAALAWIAAGCTTRSLTSELERAATRIYDLVSAVKRFTYMDRATVTESVTVAPGLRDTVAVLAAKARTKSVTVTLDVPADLPPVRAYAGELNQLWFNLLENALDAVPESGHVLVGAAREGDRVVVRVVNDGLGIPPDIQGRIFDPFFTTKRVGEGTGLGLDIARRIVGRHDGQLEFNSRPGRTEFRVTLPVDRSAAAEPVQYASTAASSDA